jgi:hypothetical protein
VYASPSFRRSAGPVDMYWLLVVRPVDFGWMWLPMIGCSCRASFAGYVRALSVDACKSGEYS